jgi:hypothetical protein
MAEPVSEAFIAIMQLAEALGVRDINKLDGCWERDLDGAWFFAVNGHQHEIACSKGAAVPPFHVYLEFNGWPAGIFSPRGGVIAAGEAANEGTFIEAVNAAIQKASA